MFCMAEFSDYKKVSHKKKEGEFWKLLWVHAKKILSSLQKKQPFSAQNCVFDNCEKYISE